MIKNEYYRKLQINSAKQKKQTFSVKRQPFLVIHGQSEQIHGLDHSIQTFRICDIDDKLKELYDNPEKLKYAPRDLVALIENYFFLNDYIRLPIHDSEETKIQLLIRRNIILGYKKYRRKLGLNDVSKIKYCCSIYGWIHFR